MLFSSPAYQFSPLFFLRLLIPLFVDVRLESLDKWARVLRVQHGHQVVDIAGGKTQGLDLGQLCVTRHVRNAISEVGKGIVDRLSSPPLFLVRASDEDRSSSVGKSGGGGRGGP